MPEDLNNEGGNAANLPPPIHAILHRVLPLLEKTELSREDMHALLDAALDLRPQLTCKDSSSPARASDAVAEHLHRVMNDITCALLQHTFGWSEMGWVPTWTAHDPVMPTFHDPSPRRSRLHRPRENWAAVISDPLALDANPVSLRRELRNCLSYSPHMASFLPMYYALLVALLGLDDGSGRIPALFRPIPKQGRGIDPIWARRLEASMWMWIACEVGRGKTRDSAIRKVAETVGVSTKAVESWRAAWVQCEGREAVQRQLAKAEAAGRAELTSPLDELLLKFYAREWRAAKLPAKLANGCSK